VQILQIIIVNYKCDCLFGLILATVADQLFFYSGTWSRSKWSCECLF